MRNKIKFIKRLAILASELDRACDYPMADAADDLMEDLCCDVMNEKRVVIIPLKEKDQKMDDGRFGLNDPKHPTVKAV